MDALDWTDRVLSLADADFHPTLCVRVLCIKAWCLWPLGRGDEQPTVTAEAESIATALADPVLLSRVLETRAMHECAHLGRLDIADGIAVEALRWANIAHDDWTIAVAAYARAMVAEGLPEVRERAETAAALLEQVGNVVLLAGMAYSALSQGSDRDAHEFIGRAMAVAEELEHPFLQMLIRGNFALTSLLTGEIDGARTRFATSSDSVASLLSCLLPKRGSRAWPQSPPPTTTTPTAQRGLPEPPPHTATACPRTRSTRESKRSSSTRPGSAPAPMLGVKRPRPAPRSASRRRSPMPWTRRAPDACSREFIAAFAEIEDEVDLVAERDPVVTRCRDRRLEGRARLVDRARP
jgi:hypothetical protein